MSASYKPDKTADHIMATMQAAYRVLYGDKGMLEFETIQEPLPSRNIFYSMFPMNHLHVAVSSRGLQMLSKIPEKVVENGLNKRKVWIEGSDPRVLRAYAEQADKDLVDFLKCRKDELKVGGSLFMLIEGRTSWSESQLGDDNDSNRKHPLNIYMDRAWEDLVDRPKTNKTDALFNRYISIAANDTELLDKACFTQVIAVWATRV